MINAYVNNRDKAQVSNLDTFSSPSPSYPTSKLPPRRVFAFLGPPQLNYVKLNFDGSKLFNGQASYGFVIKNHLNNVMLAAKSLGSHMSILWAEALGLLHVIKGALSINTSHIRIEGDNLTVINALKQTSNIRGKLLTLLMMQVLP